MPWCGPTDRKPYPTLGWQELEWMSEYLPSPLDSSQPMIFTDEQARIVLRWYEIDPGAEEFVHRRGRLEMAKGWGKKSASCRSGPCRVRWPDAVRWLGPQR
jgi:hypothetical protein